MYPSTSFMFKLTRATTKKPAFLTSGFFLPQTNSDVDAVMTRMETDYPLAEKIFVEGKINGKIVNMGYIMGTMPMNQGQGFSLYGMYGDYPIPNTIPIRLQGFFAEGRSPRAASRAASRPRAKKSKKRCPNGYRRKGSRCVKS
jgi:hypothetical protein